MQQNFFTDLTASVRQAAAFYDGVAQIIEGDGDNDQGIEFLSEVFTNARRHQDLLGFSGIDYVALGTFAGVYDSTEDHREAMRLTSVLSDLVRHAAKLDEAGIKALAEAAIERAKPKTITVEEARRLIHPRPSKRRAAKAVKR